QAALRHRKRIVAELDFPGLLVTLVHREIDHPAESKGVLFDESELLAETCPRLAGQTVRGCALVAHEEHRVAIRGARRAAKRRKPCLVQEFRDRSAGGAIGEDDVAEPGRALVARPLVQLVEEAARLRGGARRTKPANDRTALDRPGEDSEATAAEHLGDVLDDERVA